MLDNKVLHIWIEILNDLLYTTLGAELAASVQKHISFLLKNESKSAIVIAMHTDGRSAREA